MNKEKIIPQRAIVMLVGVAGSGKSTLAKKAFGNEAVIVSSDACRKELTGNEEDQTRNQEVFALFYQKIEKGIQEQKQVIADATNLNKSSRQKIYAIAKKYNVPVYALVFNIPLEVIKNQNAMRTRVVPEHVIEKMFHQMEMVYQELAQELPKEQVIDIVTMKKVEKKEKDI